MFQIRFFCKLGIKDDFEVVIVRDIINKSETISGYDVMLALEEVWM